MTMVIAAFQTMAKKRKCKARNQYGQYIPASHDDDEVSDDPSDSTDDLSECTDHDETISDKGPTPIATVDHDTYTGAHRCPGLVGDGSCPTCVGAAPLKYNKKVKKVS